MVMSVILVICAIFGKLAGALATIPEPIIGGAITVGLGLVIIVGMSQLHAVDLEATRNQMVLGLALMLGVMLPFYIEKFPDALHTGIRAYYPMQSVSVPPPLSLSPLLLSVYRL